ncbi:response regulator [Butyrivibrio sp. VCB2006]|uniref:response regulator n=1 Tax=Butyrivibrio sp. VCB2006 TaxID=1280679 RepID=UPI0004023E90|nr:response regulator [Butyrivibrio sp. VCB2006]
MKSVLIVDDSRVSRKMIRNLLEHSGYEVAAEAINGKEGLDLFLKLRPDVVAMDITMPEMNGLDSLRAIKDQVPDAKVIIISAAGQEYNKLEAMQAGAAAFVTKPYENEDILEAIRNCL